MDLKTGMVLIAGVCALILFIGVIKKKGELVLNFLVRGTVGTMGIYFLNNFLMERGIEALVGINPLNILTVGTLGAGGFGLLYGISFCSMLF